MVASRVWKTFGLCILQYSTLAFINLAKQKLHMKYGFNKVTHQIEKACAF